MSNNSVLWVDGNVGVLWIGGVDIVLPNYKPHLERAALPTTPDIVKANTVTSVYRLIIVWFKRMATDPDFISVIKPMYCIGWMNKWI